MQILSNWHHKFQSWNINLSSRNPLVWPSFLIVFFHFFLSSFWSKSQAGTHYLLEAGLELLMLMFPLPSRPNFHSFLFYPSYIPGSHILGDQKGLSEELWIIITQSLSNGLQFSNTTYVWNLSYYNEEWKLSFLCSTDSSNTLQFHFNLVRNLLSPLTSHHHGQAPAWPLSTHNTDYSVPLSSSPTTPVSSHPSTSSAASLSHLYNPVLMTLDLHSSKLSNCVCVKKWLIIQSC